MPDIVMNIVDHLDPERRKALRIVNYVGEVSVTEAAAIYSMAMQMSFRDLDKAVQRCVLQAIMSSCQQFWTTEHNEEIAGPLCQTCEGIGTVGVDLHDMKICWECDGLGVKVEGIDNKPQDSQSVVGACTDARAGQTQSQGNARPGGATPASGQPRPIRGTTLAVCGGTAGGALATESEGETCEPSESHISENCGLGSVLSVTDGQLKTARLSLLYGGQEDS